MHIHHKLEKEKFELYILSCYSRLFSFPQLSHHLELREGISTHNYCWASVYLNDSEALKIYLV